MLYIGRVGPCREDQYEPYSKMEFIFLPFREVVGKGEEVVGEKGRGFVERIVQEISEIEILSGLDDRSGGHVIYF